MNNRLIESVQEKNSDEIIVRISYITRRVHILLQCSAFITMNTNLLMSDALSTSTTTVEMAIEQIQNPKYYHQLFLKNVRTKKNKSCMSVRCYQSIVLIIISCQTFSCIGAASSDEQSWFEGNISHDRLLTICSWCSQWSNVLVQRCV